jgi:hypothetical protein
MNEAGLVFLIMGVMLALLAGLTRKAQRGIDRPRAKARFAAARYNLWFAALLVVVGLILSGIGLAS